MGNILAQYILTVYEDGRVSTVKIPTEINEVDEPTIIEEKKEFPSNMMMDISEKSSYSSFPDDWEDPGQIDVSTISVDPDISEVQYIQLAGSSARIMQMIMVLHYSKEAIEKYNSLNTDRAVTMAIDRAAKVLKVTYTTVADKITRQLNIKMPELKTMIANYFLNGDLSIKNVLLEHISKRTVTKDTDVIEKWFQNPNLPLYEGARQL